MAHTLLLADDSVTIRRVIELTFADENVRVVSVSSGRDAIASIEASPPDIVLADAGMPDVSGYDIAAFVKGRPDLKHIPVILLAGAFEPLDEARARASGSDGVLVKPFEPQMAVARVRELLSPEATPIATPRAEPPPPVEPAAPAPAEPAFDPALDQLDASFASAATDTTYAPAAASPGFERQEFGEWDLPLRPSSEGGAPSIPPLPPPITLAPKAAPDRPPAQHDAPLAEAFSNLLAREEGRPHGPMPAIVVQAPSEGSALSGQDMDVIVDRLIARLGPDVRGVVLDLAERLVRAEIERLKALR
ncbi:MAG: response regulator [Vicinamibacterales bacterium]